MWLAGTPEGLVRISSEPDEEAFRRGLAGAWPERPAVRDPEALGGAERQIREYLSGGRREFDLPLNLARVSEFDRAVLMATAEIPFGEVASYGEIAGRIGRPAAARAVGGALGRNPLPLVLPCHRVIRSDGELGGYAGGRERKERLLRLEGRDPSGGPPC